MRGSKRNNRGKRYIFQRCSKCKNWPIRRLFCRQCGGRGGKVTTAGK